MKYLSFIALLIAANVWILPEAATRAQTPVLAPSGRLDWPTEVLQHQVPGQLEIPVVTQVAIHPTAPLAAIVGDDHKVSLVNLDSGRLEKTLKGHSDWIRAAEFHPTGDRLITAGVDRKILSWDLATGQWNLFASVPCSVEDLSISPDGQWLAVVGFDAKLRIFQIDSTIPVFEDTAPCPDMRSVQFSPSGQCLVAGGRCGTIRCWTNRNQQWVASQQDARAHRQRIRSMEFIDESTVVSCSEDRTIQKTDLKTMTSTLLAETDGRKFDIEVIDKRSIACCGSTNRIELFDIIDGRSIGFLEGHRGTVSCLEYRDGQLLSGSFDTDARVWKTRQETSLPANDRTASFDMPAIQRSASSQSLSPPPSLK